jgi:hypothetical protein
MKLKKDDSDSFENIFLAVITDRNRNDYGEEILVKKLGILYREFNNKKPLADREYFSSDQIRIIKESDKKENFHT